MLKPMMEKIIMAACQHFGCTEEELMEKSKAADVFYRRSICFYLISQNVVISPARIAKRFGFEAHSTVSRPISSIEVQKNIYAHIKQDLNKVMEIANNLDVQFTTYGMDNK